MVKGRKFVSYSLIVWKADYPNPPYANVYLQEEGRDVLELALS
jgi:hypothetical protein